MAAVWLRADADCLAAPASSLTEWRLGGVSSLSAEAASVLAGGYRQARSAENNMAAVNAELFTSVVRDSGRARAGAPRAILFCPPR